MSLTVGQYKGLVDVLNGLNASFVVSFDGGPQITITDSEWNHKKIGTIEIKPYETLCDCSDPKIQKALDTYIRSI